MINPSTEVKEEKIYFRVNGEILAGNKITSVRRHAEPRLLFLHGAGKATKERTKYLATHLAKGGISSFGFDFSGHGESTGNLDESSLQKRTLEALAAYSFLAKNSPISICGSSMGGHIALEIMKIKPIVNLVLFCPALYSKDAYKLQFNQGFSAVIREEHSWENADVFDALNRFTGNLLIFIGSRDEVIPPGVISALDSHSQRSSSKQIIVLPGCPHQLHTWLLENNSERELVFNKILEIIA